MRGKNNWNSLKVLASTIFDVKIGACTEVFERTPTLKSHLPDNNTQRKLNKMKRSEFEERKNAMGKEFNVCECVCVHVHIS